jgi:hypothetical protein
MQRASRISWVATLGIGLATCGGDRAPADQPPGQPETTETKALEAGAKVLQREGPTDTLDVYLVGFHPLADDPSHVMEAHHYCKQMNEDFAQCALWDGNTNDANLTGIEYIISARLFAQLPVQEQRYWHPHNYEILSGQLVAPGLPRAAEQALMKSKMNSYGKTWHVWHTGDMGTDLPLGPAHLAWSFNADGELPRRFIDERDDDMGTDTERTRRDRQSLVPLAEPQHGVDALAEAFAGRTKPPGVVSATNDGSGQQQADE